ncbi:dynein heavy chain [Elasticomyces elasticus]|nr:dynein heavy chain [Elasticomyces elasticus]KAK4979738.1 dynein heavy chain [Elasticomyces elasticus]
MPLDVYRYELFGFDVVFTAANSYDQLGGRRRLGASLPNVSNTSEPQHVQNHLLGSSRRVVFQVSYATLQNWHEKRHREIAELLHQFKELQIPQHPDTQPTTPSTPRFPHHQVSSPLPKKERKAARKAAKVASMPKVITTADIEFVANVLHPDDHDDDIDEERRLLEDPDIKLNLYYNKGTSNTRESRHRHIKGKQQKSEAELEFDVVELDAIMVGLKVPAANQAKTAAERKLIELIRTAVRDDMVNVAKEQGQTQMRKAGFWRWASKKVYNRLLQNGRLWDQTAEAETPKRKDSAYGGEEDAAAPISTLKVDEMSAAAESTPAPKENTSKSTRSAWTSATVTPSKVDDGWTQIGKVSRKPVVKGKIKLSGNGGLAKLLVKAPGMFGELGTDGLGYVEGMDRGAMEEPATTGGNGVVANGSLTAPATLVVDPQAVVTYLSSVLEVTLGATQAELAGPGSLLHRDLLQETVARCQRFAQETQVSLYVLRKATPVQYDGQTIGDSAHFHDTYQLSSTVSYDSRTTGCVAFLKKPFPISPDVSISRQVSVVNLPLPGSYLASESGTATSPYESLHALVRGALTPLFEAAARNAEPVNEKQRPDGEARTGVSGARRRLADLEVSLQNLQQNIEVEAPRLQIHEAVQAQLDDANGNWQAAATHIPEEAVSDSTLLNKLQSMANDWIKQIREFTRIADDRPVGSTTQEKNFWLAMETAIDGIEAQLAGGGVQLSMKILEKAKRHGITASFSSDTQLSQTKEMVQKYNTLFHGFPVEELLSATTVEKLRDALDDLFSHLNKKLRVCPYPVKRALPLVEAISADVDARLHDLLHGRTLMHMNIDDFKNIIAQVEQIWDFWEDLVKDFTNVAREATRRRNDKFIPIKITKRHAKTQDRLKYIYTFRDNHDQLQRTIVNVLGPEDDALVAVEHVTAPTVVQDSGDVDAVDEIAQAYLAVRDVDVLDTTPEGERSWTQAEATYNERTARVENSIIARLRDRLAVAKTANEMFRVFSKFNALFVRPKIRGAIAEYQLQLISNVRDDIEALQKRFTHQYGQSEAHAMAQLHDLPPISGAIIRARQIERQLNNYMSKVGDILGPKWAQHTDGQKLSVLGEGFRRKLDTKPIFDDWLRDITRRHLSISGRLFAISQNRARGNHLDIHVNFDSQVITLFKEVRNLLWLNFPVPHGITNVSKDARRVYPFAVSLMESLNTLAQTNMAIDNMSEVTLLLSGFRNDVHSLVGKGTSLKWESFVLAYDVHMRHATSDGQKRSALDDKLHVQFIHNLGNSIATLQSKVSALSIIQVSVNATLRELQTCVFSPDTFRAQLEALQRTIDQLNLEAYSNIAYWAAAINEKVIEILRHRLQQALKDWSDQFEHGEDGAREAKREDGTPNVETYSHDLVMQNQLIQLEPPLEDTRAGYLDNLHTWLGTVCQLPRLQASRFENALTIGVSGLASTYRELPLMCMDTLAGLYESIEAKLDVAQTYIDEWLQFQSLWDLQLDQIQDDLGEELDLWLQLILEIRQKRDTFDTSGSQRSFGHLVINYEQVQAKVNSKYDQWQHDLLAHFSDLFATRLVDVYTELQRARKDLEGSSMQTSSTAQAVTFITIVQTCKRQTKVWEPEMVTFRHGQQTLSRLRYQYPKEWLYVEQVDHEWMALVEVLERKSKLIADQTDALRAKIIAEDGVVSRRISEATERWNEQRPVSGSIPPAEATATLDGFDNELTQLREQSEMVSKAKEALELPAGPDNALVTLLEEVQDFQSVWANLTVVWDQLTDLRDQPWNSVQPRKLRQSIDTLIKTTKEMPSRMRQYAAFEHVQTVLRQLLKVNPLLTEMRSDAVRERHWVRIFKGLQPSKRYSALSMTLGDVWDLQLGSSETAIRDVIAQAQGEMALEEFLRTVREHWQSYTLDLVNYQNKCRLIRGWDDLFAKCSEHLNSLQAMRHSPYYKQFEEEASAWEDRLNRVHVLFDVWIDVQRQWVYLEGVFTGNADIKHLLPMESSRFASINSEFMSVLKKVYRAPQILEVLNLPDVQRSLERLADLLNKIQKALGEYLEKERSAFPRFYFVGDEDLLEIIGNSNDTIRIAKHLRKMFAGIAGLVMDEESTILGLSSKEGEEVILKTPISLVATPKVNEWLKLLESGMRESLSDSLTHAVATYQDISHDDSSAFEAYTSHYSAQIVVLAAQACWTSRVTAALSKGAAELQSVYDALLARLEFLATTVLRELEPLHRKKCEHLITEFVHQRDVIDRLIKGGADSPGHYLWLLQMRYEFDETAAPLDRMHIRVANASLAYGFEYLGVPERLVRTPLTDRCFLTLTQALCQRLGGSPYGPAGTGKTESVKALGVQLGRFTLVFNCDDTFDFQAMGRIFLGISQVGAWGCFDEFNRLEERILSAVSQQIQNIQVGLRKRVADPDAQIDLVGRQLKVHPLTGMFITMNPGYAGRSNLPDNLKKLFRSVAMSKPDKEIIAEVMLFSQGFANAKALSRQTVPFFDTCGARLSKQPHYDFGLRALKSVLISSGALKRSRVALGSDKAAEFEPQIIVQSIRETIAPKLVRADASLMEQIEAESFPGVQYIPAPLVALRKALHEVVDERKLVATDAWLTKVLQLYQIQSLHHGVMMVGSSGTGKSTAWQVLLAALQKVDGIEGVCHVIDPKVISKEALYGNLDSTTREWTDGLFTGILRKVVDNLRGEDSKRHWIVFDGDVDPEWVENLNSVLDDNKLLTLPNGERLSLPSNVRIMFEVETLRYATLATVSRCGMVWFSDETVELDVLLSRNLAQLQMATFDDIEDDSAPATSPEARNAILSLMVDILRQRLTADDFVKNALERCEACHHIMQFSAIRAIGTLFSLLRKACHNMLEYNSQHPDFPLSPEQEDAYLSKKLLLATVWAFTGDCPLTERKSFGDYLSGLVTLDMPLLSEQSSLIDYDVSLPSTSWSPWQNQVPSIEVNTHSVTQTDMVIPTLDTVRHEDVLYSFLAEHKPLLLCGPPGSGKTMTLFSALRKLPNMEVVGLNFSSATTPDLLVKTLEQYCDYRKTLNGVTMAPTQIGRWLVVFCDEINLPAPDKYGTQRVISFLRQLVEQGGFWRTTTKTWVSLERIQFVGACNPPTDAGRTPLGLRFLRHAPLVMVDYPGDLSLTQIYGTFNAAVLKLVPSLRGYADALTQAMIQVYTLSQKRFTADVQPHYIYSPRELTRWVRAIYEALRPLETLSLEGLVRIWAHEALRLFADRLIADDERQWTDETVDRVALEHFPNINEVAALERPILFSNWLSKNYVPVGREQLRDFVKARLHTFCEEELDVPLILFNDVLEHVLRIDRVFRQPQGHLILIGVSGSGKTTLSRFVAWMNGLSVFQIKVHGKYSAEDFDDDLRNVLRRCGCRGEKICFIMDESNVLDSGFLERMNTLLANGEVPGLFEGDEYTTLMTACKEGAQRQGLLLDSQEELYRWFTQQIVRNLHVVFTMNPPTEGLSSRAATSPALFNRCVLNWFGDWSDQALYQVAYELTQSVDIDKATFAVPEHLPIEYDQLEMPLSHREAVVNSMVHVHHSIHSFNQRLQRQQNKMAYLSPRQFLDFVAQFVKLYNEKRDDLEEQQRHLNVGLDKLRETVDKVSELKKSLAEKKAELERKDAEAGEKLQRMVTDQREAEQRRAASLEIQVALDKQEKEVAERREVVLSDLANAEPAVLEAQRSVSNIKKQHLTEVRSMQNPPAGVKLALESVCTLLGHRATDWKSIIGIIRRDDFIASIVNYDNERQMTPQHRIKMRNDYLSKEEFTFERANRASKACGPLVQWVEAQVNYSEILDRVGPLREEVNLLEQEALQTKAEAKMIESTLVDLEQSIATYKKEYAALISQTEAIKAEMSRVQSKVDRSMRLLNSLSSERGRWEQSSTTFATQMETIIGDVFLAAAFLAYSGLYDQQYRRALLEDWSLHLASSGVTYKAENALSEYLSTADQRQQWHDNALPVDELCTENAIVLQRYNRYPLIIDPSGRVTQFLQNESKERRLTVTSFLDGNFVKQLESALRFGNPILIQDAEHMDPILNHVLNKEYQRTGGRVLIQLGKQEIDFSPAFKLYLSTRDPSAHFAPDVCSRTTFVNFTVTQSSLKTQTLNDVLKSERPDVDERRSNLVKMQGEFTQRLRRLERMLLQALNESHGNILDDENVIQTLETLKNEAADITAKASETEGVMTEVNSIMNVYDVVARSCSAIFAVLEQLYHVHHFYQFSLQYFVDIFQAVLSTARASTERDPKTCIDAMLRDLFKKTYHETSASLLQKDRLTLAVLLAQASPFPMDKALLDTLLDHSLPGVDVNTTPGQTAPALAAASRLTALKDIMASAGQANIDDFLTAEQAELHLPGIAASGDAINDNALKGLLLVKLLRVDRLVPATERFVSTVFGNEFFEVTEDLGRVARDTIASSPIALCSTPGFDASYKVDQLVERAKKSCASVAMGSNEGVASADAALANAAANGSWVLIKNVHLAAEWLQNLVKRIDSLKPHNEFRLFLSMETSLKIPSSLLRASRVLMYEQPAGIRANMRDSLSSLPDQALQQPVEKARVHFLLSYLHAVVQERLRYAPRLGWKGYWEFNDADYDCSAFVIQWWTDYSARGRSNVAPRSIPWEMLRVLVATMYGGKIDDAEDMAQLQGLVDKALTAEAFEEGFNLIGEVAGDAAIGIALPAGTTKKDFTQWVTELPEREPPTYLGLPANAEKLLLVAEAEEMLKNLRTVMNVLDEGEHIMAEAVEV